MLNIEALNAFVAVVDAGSFSAAAERLGQTTSAISRTMSRLEAQLGATLMTRTTRRLDLTEEGAWFLERARGLLAELQETEDLMAARLSQPAGLVRVNAATPVLNHLLAPLVPAFMDTFPLVRLELIGAEAVVDLIGERADLAIRVGPLADSTLHARRLGSSRLRLVAAPRYLREHGEPTGVPGLAPHRLLGFTEPASLNLWPLQAHGAQGLPIQPALAASSGETIRHLALAGAGIACLADFLTRADVAQGALVPVLAPDTLAWSQPVWAVFYKQGALAPRVDALVRFLAERLCGQALDD